MVFFTSLLLVYEKTNGFRPKLGGGVKCPKNPKPRRITIVVTKRSISTLKSPFFFVLSMLKKEEEKVRREG